MLSILRQVFVVAFLPFFRRGRGGRARAASFGSATAAANVQLAGSSLNEQGN